LCDDDSEQAGDGDLSVAAGDDQERAYGHCNDVKDEESVRDTPGNWPKEPVLEICRKAVLTWRVRDAYFSGIHGGIRADRSIV
jgi:hypothetical protein